MDKRAQIELILQRFYYNETVSIEEAAAEICAFVADSLATSAQWKPEHEDTFYVVNWAGDIGEMTWCADEIDMKAWVFGNVFRTRQEAEQAREKIKEVLLNFHNHE